MFKPVESVSLARFNSSNSSEFLELYENAVDEDIRASEVRLPSKTFAPSQVRCKRVSWFRLRGVQPEQEVVVDRATKFTAQIGTACHQAIQETLAKKLGAAWLDPAEYLKDRNFQYEYSCAKNDLETQITITDPVPIKFAPDGVIYWKDRHWLLEIKTSEYSSFEKLTGPKPQHIDQVKCYATLLGLHNVLMIYQDRMYGGIKCYEVKITDADMQEIWDMFKEVQDCVTSNIAPEKPLDRKYCTPTYCRYYEKCKEW